MSLLMDRREFVRLGAVGVVAAPTVFVPKSVPPVVISDRTGYVFRNGGPMNAVEKAFSMITSGTDVLDALIAGVNIPELDPEETGVGYGGLPNEDGVVQLDSCCMHGPKKRAGGVAALEGVRTPSLVAKAANASCASRKAPIIAAVQPASPAGSSADSRTASASSAP